MATLPGLPFKPTTHANTTMTPMTNPQHKTLYLIRHAESLENERLASLSRSVSRIAKLSLPTRADLSRSTELLNVAAQVDSDVSPKGTDQISQLATKLHRDNFLVDRGVELVVHSPLSRARQTSEGMLGCVSPDTLAEPVKRVEELDCLLEKTLSEWVPGNYAPFAKRIAEFEAWVRDQPEEVLAIVGHSQFFKAMLGLDYKFGNCDVWEVKFDCAVEGVEEKEEEEKKDDSPSSLGASEEEEKDAEKKQEEEGGNGTELLGGWSDLKNLYKYEVKVRDEEYERTSSLLDF